MVEVKNLYKKYGDFVALDDLNFDVADGEVFGFVGPNGAGKTTTMRIMAGLNQPDRGSITIAGTDDSYSSDGFNLSEDAVKISYLIASGDEYGILCFNIWYNGFGIRKIMSKSFGTCGFGR